MEKFLTTLLIAVVSIVVVSFLLAWPVQFLWNECLVGAVNGVNSIGFLQALGINFLASILFKTTVNTK